MKKSYLTKKDYVHLVNILDDAVGDCAMNAIDDIFDFLKEITEKEDKP